LEQSGETTNCKLAGETVPLSCHVRWLPYAFTLADMRFDGDGGLMNMIMIIMIKNIKQNYTENKNKSFKYDNTS